MAAKKGSGGRRRRPKPKEEPAAQSPNGILITLEPIANSEDRDLTVAALGDVKRTELPALLGVARRVTEEQLGIGGG